MAVESVSEFLSLLQRSRLFDSRQMGRARRAAQRPEVSKALHLARWLVKSQQLTVWQAERLLGRSCAFYLGNYKFLERVGEGAMGVVFKAEHSMMGRVVALKVLSKARLSNPSALARFQREMQAVAALNHPNIVTAFDAGCVDKTHYLVLEFIRGIDLSAWQKHAGCLPVGLACEFIRQAALGLHHAHLQGMVHRDIKPANILVSWREDENRPVVKLLDLGLARIFNEEEDAEAVPDSTDFSVHDTVAAQLTQFGTILGTPDYLAPEQVRDDMDVDARSDIFSLGCTLFELITGRLPYDGPDLVGKLQARSSTDGPPAVRLRTLLPEVDEELDAVVAEMLHREPDKRFQTALQVATALEPLAQSPQQPWEDVAAQIKVSANSSEISDSRLEPDPRLRNFLDALAEAEPAVAESVPLLSSQPPQELETEAPIPVAELPSADFPSEANGPLSESVSAEQFPLEPQPVGRRKWIFSAVAAMLGGGSAAAYWALRETPPPPVLWPGNTAGLVFLWADALSPNLLPDPLGGPPRECTVVADGDAGLYQDRAMWLHGEGAFIAQAVADELLTACQGSGQFSLEMIVRPANLQQSGPARIFSFSSGAGKQNVTLSQQGAQLLVHLRTSESDGEMSNSPVRLCELSAAAEHLIVTYRSGLLACYRNGQPAGQSDAISGDLSVWSDCHVLFGREWLEGFPWQGRIEGIALRSRSVAPLEAGRLFALARERKPSIGLLP